MNEAQSVLLEHLAASLFGKPTESAITGEVYDEAERHTVVSLLPISGSLLYWRIVARNTSILVEHQKVHAIMVRHGIPYVTLKGIASCSYYPKPELRQMGDVDFIVKEDDFERACAALDAEGFEGHKDMQEHHVRYNTGSCWWELHWRAPGFPENHPIERYVEEMIDQAVEQEGCMCASPFHHGLILLTHSAYHWINAGFTLRHVCDWAVFYSHFEEAEFLRMFEAPLKEVGLWKYAQLLTAVSMRYLSAPKACWVGEHDEEYLAALMEDILNQDAGKVNQAKLMTDEGSITVDNTGMIQRFFTILTRKAYLIWPACEKYKILVPFGMLAHMVRYVFLIACGKKPKVNLHNMIAGAQKRKKLYLPFELFQAGEEK